MCYEDADEFAEPISEGWRTARKPHCCFACKETVRPGDRYYVTVQKFEGELSEYKHCARCAAITVALFRAGAEAVQWDLHCDTPYEDAFGDLPEDVAALAFMTPDEAQIVTAPPRPAGPWRRV